MWENIDYDHVTFALFITESCDTGESVSPRIATESRLHLVLPKLQLPFGKATGVVNHVRSANLQDVIGKADELVISSQSAYTGAVRG